MCACSLTKDLGDGGVPPALCVCTSGFLCRARSAGAWALDPGSRVAPASQDQTACTQPGAGLWPGGSSVQKPATGQTGIQEPAAGQTGCISQAAGGNLLCPYVYTYICVCVHKYTHVLSLADLHPAQLETGGG